MEYGIAILLCLSLGILRLLQAHGKAIIPVRKSGGRCKIHGQPTQTFNENDRRRRRLGSGIVVGMGGGEEGGGKGEGK